MVLRMSSLRVARVVSRETWPSPGGGEARRCGGRTISETAREVSREACCLVGVEEVLYREGGGGAAPGEEGGWQGVLPGHLRPQGGGHGGVQGDVLLPGQQAGGQRHEAVGGNRGAAAPGGAGEEGVGGAVLPHSALLLRGGGRGAPGRREPDLRAPAAPRLLLGGFGSGGGAAGGPGEVEVHQGAPREPGTWWRGGGEGGGAQGGAPAGGGGCRCAGGCSTTWGGGGGEEHRTHLRTTAAEQCTVSSSSWCHLHTSYPMESPKEGCPRDLQAMPAV